MKMIQVSEEFYNSAIKLSEYIGDDDSEKSNYKQAKEEGLEKEDHIYYHAAIVGGWEDQLE